MKLCVVLVALFLVSWPASGFIRPLISEPHVLHSDGTVDEAPLILTQYLNDPSLGQSLSSVQGLWKYPSYSGFFSINATTGSTTYFWFFPAQNGNTKAPVILFLEGGPGVSSLLSLFYQMGPFHAAPNGTSIIPNPFTWNKDYAMIFVDNPVGSGYSFTLKEYGMVRDEHDVARDLYSFVEQFYTIFPNYLPNDLYVCDTYPLYHPTHTHNGVRPIFQLVTSD